MNATSPISEVTFPPYTLTGGVAYRELARDEDLFGTDECRPMSTKLSGNTFGPGFWACVTGLKENLGKTQFSNHEYRRRLDPTPDNYRAMQAAWLSHFSVGVGSRVRVVRIPSGIELGWPDVNSYEMTRCRDKIHEVIAIHPQNGIALDCDVWFPFHVLAPVEEQPKVEVIELTDLTRGWDVPMGVTHLVEVPLPGEGEVWSKDRYVSRHGEQWFSMDWAIGKTVDGTLTPGRYRCARRAEPHEHPPAVPEGQGEVVDLIEEGGWLKEGDVEIDGSRVYRPLKPGEVIQNNDGISYDGGKTWAPVSSVQLQYDDVCRYRRPVGEEGSRFLLAEGEVEWLRARVKRDDAELTRLRGEVERLTTLTSNMGFVAEHADEKITTLTADLGKKEEELRRWKQSFDGHVYVPRDEYQALHANLREKGEDVERFRQSMYALEDRVGQLRSVLEKISKDDCGCTTPCQCDFEPTLRTWKEATIAMARKALKGRANA